MRPAVYDQNPVLVQQSFGKPCSAAVRMSAGNHPTARLELALGFEPITISSTAQTTTLVCLVGSL